MTQKIFFIILFTLGLVFFRPSAAHAGGCNITTPDRIAKGDDLRVDISGMKDYTTYNYTVSGTSRVFITSPSSKYPDEKTSATFYVKNVDGPMTLRFQVREGSGSDCLDTSIPITVLVPQTPGAGSGIASPSSWLPFIKPTPGFPSPIQGVWFFAGDLKNFVISLLLFLLITGSLIFTIIGGIMWIMGGGNKEALAKAKNTVTYAIVGLVLGLGSFIILNILGTFFGVKLL